MNPDFTSTAPVKVTLEARQATLSYQDVADILNLGSAKSSFLEFSPCSSDDIVPQKMDILCGRNKEAFGHVGNRRFRALISGRRDDYQNAKARDIKTSITTEIVASIRECGGRFLRKDDKSNMWYEVGDDDAHEKVSHALRSAKAPETTCRKKKQNATDRPSPVFQMLLAQQQQIFQAMLKEEQLSRALDSEEAKLKEEQLSRALDSEEEEHLCNISV